MFDQTDMMGYPAMYRPISLEILAPIYQTGVEQLSYVTEQKLISVSPIGIIREQ
jgi:hypothetical protein